MLLKKQVRAGVLLYALLMAAIFALLLDFYLDRMVASQRQVQVLDKASQAYLMAEMVEQEAQGQAGEVSFDQGRANYQLQSGLLSISVDLASGEHYSYSFVRSEPPKEAKPDEAKASSSTSSSKKEKTSSTESSSEASSTTSKTSSSSHSASSTKAPKISSSKTKSKESNQTDSSTDSDQEESRTEAEETIGED